MTKIKEQKMRDLKWTLLGLCLLCQPLQAEEPADIREPFAATAIEKAYILGQMRLFIGSIQEISESLGDGNLKAVADAAAARGRRMNAGDPNFPASLSAKLPPLWKQIGGSLRADFDALSDAAKAGAPTEKILQILGRTMKNCVACHQTYKIAGENF